MGVSGGGHRCAYNPGFPNHPANLLQNDCREKDLRTALSLHTPKKRRFEQHNTDAFDLI
jgi:hypothetical protein